MAKKFYLPLLMLAVLMMTSCSSKMGALKSSYFTTTPEVLEAVGGKVPVTINGQFPEKFFKKNVTLTVTPVLKWDGGQVEGEPAIFQGEKVEGNYKTINYKNGGNFVMRSNFNYQPEMEKSELYLNFKVQKKGKTYDLPPVKIADGVISTSELVKNTLSSANTTTAEDAYQRIIKQKKEANIMFLIQQANLRQKELKSAGMKDFNNTVKDVKNDTKGKAFENVEISAYASPDGGVSLNDKLANKRENNTTDFLKKQLKKEKVNTNVDSKYTAQDWEGFQELVSKSDIQDKDLILRVLSMYQDPEKRETEIHNISAAFRDLADDILPQLRRSRLTLNYQLIGRSDEEINETLKSDPKALNVEELLYSATLTNNDSEKKDIYTKATEYFPQDFRAYNNLGELAYHQGNYSDAANYYKKAADLNPNSAEANTNMGLLSLINGDKDAAATYLAKGTGAKTLNEALGNLYVAQGQYDRAVNSFGDTASNSAALAQILSKNYSAASTTLSNIKNADAYTSYLKAIVGARTNDASAVVNNLKEAIGKNSTLAKRAAKDLEFVKYFTSSDFQSLVK